MPPNRIQGFLAEAQEEAVVMEDWEALKDPSNLRHQTIATEATRALGTGTHRTLKIARRDTVDLHRGQEMSKNNTAQDGRRIRETSLQKQADTALLKCLLHHQNVGHPQEKGIGVMVKCAVASETKACARQTKDTSNRRLSQVQLGQLPMDTPRPLP
jgi:hypothetical protein